jgi:hypothetical protein
MSEVGQVNCSIVLCRLNADRDRPSEKRFRSGLHGQSIQEVFQGLLSRHVSRVMGREAAFPQLDAHGSSFAMYFPAPGVLIAARSGNDNVE